jgi:hypothetical protein
MSNPGRVIDLQEGQFHVSHLIANAVAFILRLPCKVIDHTVDTVMYYRCLVFENKTLTVKMSGNLDTNVRVKVKSKVIK